MKNIFFVHRRSTTNCKLNECEKETIVHQYVNVCVNRTRRLAQSKTATWHFRIDNCSCYAVLLYRRTFKNSSESMALILECSSEMCSRYKGCKFQSSVLVHFNFCTCAARNIPRSDVQCAILIYFLRRRLIFVCIIVLSTITKWYLVVSTISLQYQIEWCFASALCVGGAFSG